MVESKRSAYISTTKKDPHTMSDMIATALTEGAKAWGRVRSDEARYAYLSATPALRGQVEANKNELTLPGVELKNYTDRSEVPDADGFVLVTTHEEHLEKKFVPTPPLTQAEIESLRVHKRYLAKIWGSVAAVGIAVGGIVVIAERRSNSKNEHETE